MKAAIYCRVSTTGQAENGSSLESQRDACLKLAAEAGYQVPSDYIFLEDWTGADLDRPKLEQARELVRSGQAQVLMAFAVDRLARNPIHVGILAEECAKFGADLLFVLEPLDNSPEGALILYVKGFAAQIERERIKERTLRGKRSRARLGFLVQGTGKGIYGYRYDRELKKRIIYEPEAQIVRGIFDACASGTSCHSIAVHLNQEGVPAFAGGLWHPLTIKRILTNTSFKGVTIYGKTRRIGLPGKRQQLELRDRKDWIEILGATPAIVTEDLFTAAQDALSKPKRNPKTGREYVLTGYIECSCGTSMVGTTLGKKYKYYRCRATSPTSTRPKTCDASYVPGRRLEEEVWRVVREVLEQPDVVVEELERQRGGAAVLEEEMKRLQSSIRKLADQEKRLIRLYGVGQVTEEYVLREIEQAKKARESLEKDLGRRQQQAARLNQLEDLGDRVRAFCGAVSERLGQFDFDEKRLAFQALQVRIIVDKDGARLRGAIPTDFSSIEQTWASPRGCRSPTPWTG